MIDARLFFAAFLGAVCAWVVWRVQLHRRRRRALAAYGLPVRGIVQQMRQVRVKGRLRQLLTYQYTVGGRTYTRHKSVSATDYARFAEGEPIELIYLPDEPDIAQPDFIIGRMHPG